MIKRWDDDEWGTSSHTYMTRSYAYDVKINYWHQHITKSLSIPTTKLLDNIIQYAMIIDNSILSSETSQIWLRLFNMLSSWCTRVSIRFLIYAVYSNQCSLVFIARVWSGAVTPSLESEIVYSRPYAMI